MNESPTSSLGPRLRSRFDQVERDRREMENRWLAALRQYRGVYDPAKLQAMDPERSRAFLRMTRIKVRSADSRLMDLLFPAGSDDNWAIEPTPIPEFTLEPATMASLMLTLGRMPTPSEISMQAALLAKSRAANMATAMKDQLADTDYKKIMRAVIHSGNLFGTGILKGPMVNRKSSVRWTVNSMTGAWEPAPVALVMPHIEHVPVWESYPDPTAVDFSDLGFHFQRTVVSRHHLLSLANRPDFNGGLIRRYLSEVQDSDVKPLWWETQLRDLGWNAPSAGTKHNRYELLEFWGLLEPADLASLDLGDSNVELPDMWANVFLLGHHVVKIELQPLEGVQTPFYAYYWDKDETSVFGEGIAAIMSDDQDSLNSAIRAMQDNASIAAGPQLEVNVDLLAPGEDPLRVHPFRVWQRSGIGSEANYPALRSVTLPSHTQEYLALAGFFANNIHEATIPSYMHGEATSKGSVGRTVGGLSMLMSAAQITFKDQLFALDSVQSQFLKALYRWNMQYNDDPDIKGDFNVVVKGISSLVAREIRAQNLDAFANSTLNEVDRPYIDRRKLNEQRASVLELGKDIVLSPEAIAIQQQESQINASQYPPTDVPGFAARDQSVSGGVPNPTGDAGIPAVPQAAGPMLGGYQGPVG